MNSIGSVNNQPAPLGSQYSVFLGSSSTSLNGGLGGSNHEVPRFDKSEFPALGEAMGGNSAKGTARPATSAFSLKGVGGPPSVLGGGRNHGMSAPQNFMKKTDFPALGAKSSLEPRGVTSSRTGEDDQRQATYAAVGQLGLKQGEAARRQENVSERDRFGLKGLLNVIRMTDPDLNTLALGTDLTSLGLNLNSSDVLYATFAYPCGEVSSRREPDYILPACYYVQPPALKTSHLSKFELETLFYIFYNMPKDTLQVYAAKELYNRNWRYHKDLKTWFTRPSEANIKSHGYGRESIVYFDINSWEKRLFRDTNLPGGPKFMTEQELNESALNER